VKNHPYKGIVKVVFDGIFSISLHLCQKKMMKKKSQITMQEPALNEVDLPSREREKCSEEIDGLIADIKMRNKVLQKMIEHLNVTPKNKTH
jgi:hypothetical protein